MAPGADPAFQQAMDKLLLKVDRDNVLAVHTAFQGFANQLANELNRIRDTSAMGLCGSDPISRQAVQATSFGGKISQLLDAHWKHLEEISTVAENLRQTARSYGHTEDAITHSYPKSE